MMKCDVWCVQLGEQRGLKGRYASLLEESNGLKAQLSRLKAELAELQLQVSPTIFVLLFVFFFFFVA